MNPQLLIEWLGAGGVPVAKELAEQRASICLATQCPENRAPRWWEHAVDAIAETIRSILEVKHRLNLSVKNEDELQMCRACGCCLRLKVWTPIEHIRAQPETQNLDGFPSWCWIRQETTQ